MECTNAYDQVSGHYIDENIDFAKYYISYRPSTDNAYICTSMKIANKSTKYITGFEGVANATRAHHVQLLGCKTPGKTDPVFNCGIMGAKPPKDPKYPFAPDVCGTGTPRLLYYWANGSPKDEPELHLPEDVGFPVSGLDSNIDWLVLQIHYKNVDSIPEEGDNAGVIVQYTDVPRLKTAGILDMRSGGTYPPLSTTQNEVACQLREDLVIHPFRYRVHTHGIGTFVSGWKVTQDMSWTLIGKKDPQLPQAFYSIQETGMTMTKGDILASRCTMVNTRNKTVKTGLKDVDEMCAFQVMYWVEGPQILNGQHCQSSPSYSWNGGKHPILHNIPDNLELLLE